MDVITGIVFTVGALGLVAIIISQQVVHYKERIAMEKLKKVKDVQDMNYLFPNKEPEIEEEEEERFLPVDDITEDMIAQ